jgi:heme A synthase
VTQLTATAAVPPAPPRSAWALALSCLVGAVVGLADRGFSDANGVSILVSVGLSALVVGWVSSGVLRARTGRLVLAWVIFSVEAVLGLITVVSQLPTPPGTAVADLATSLASIASLALFSRTDFFRLQRSGPAGPAPAIEGLLLVAVTVGGLGGLAAPVNGEGPGIHVHVGT